MESALYRDSLAGRSSSRRGARSRRPATRRGSQIQHCLDNGWSVSVEFTDDPHPRNIYWEMWGMPMFDIDDASACFSEVQVCREA